MTEAVLVGALAGWFLAGGTKTQAVRLGDVVLLGPLMIYAASSGADCYYPSEELGRRRAVSWALAAAGGATITYNARNFLS
jgi:hypothetical protein